MSYVKVAMLVGPNKNCNLRYYFIILFKYFILPISHGKAFREIAQMDEILRKCCENLGKLTL